MKIPQQFETYKEVAFSEFKGAKIKKPEPKNKGDTRGPVYELYQGIPGKQLTILHRNKGVIFAEHFHHGTDPSKNPEFFYFVTGKAFIYCFDRTTRTYAVTTADENTLLEIDPLIFHIFECVEKVVFVEYRRSIYSHTEPDDGTTEEYVK